MKTTYKKSSYMPINTVVRFEFVLSGMNSVKYSNAIDHLLCPRSYDSAFHDVSQYIINIEAKSYKFKIRHINLHVGHCCNRERSRCSNRAERKD
jgi:hypothetical protein